jgi:hypothetical protein
MLPPLRLRRHDQAARFAHRFRAFACRYPWERVQQQQNRFANAWTQNAAIRARLDRKIAASRFASKRAAQCSYGMAMVRPGIPGRHDGQANLVIALAQSFCVPHASPRHDRA